MSTIQVKKRYGLIGVVGDREDGKTTWVAQFMKRELNRKPGDPRIVYKKGYANIHYNKSPEITFTNYAGIKLLDEANKQGVPEIIVHMDQIHKYADSINWNGKEAKEFIETLIESRQHGFDIVMTTWARSAFHPRLRKFVKLWVGAKQMGDGFHYDYFDVDEKRFLTPDDGLVLNFAQAQTIWPYFNTGELVDDDTLSKIAYAKPSEKKAIAKKLAVYKPCG